MGHSPFHWPGMAAVGEAGADRFRPHFLAIEWDYMVDAFKSGAAVVNSGTFHTPAHPHVECELAEVTVGAERELVSAGGMAIIPAQVPHDPLNVGSETLRFLAIFPSAVVLHTWEVPVMPIGGRMFVTPAPVEEDTQAAPIDST